MKKIALLSVLTASILFSKENVEDIKSKGIEYFKSNNYSLAVEEFLKINDYSQSSNIDFYLARSYYELGMDEKALIIFERILINEPDNKRVQLEIAQTYLMLDSYDIAKVSFQELIDDPSIPTVVKSNIEDRLKFIDEKTKKHFFSSTLMFGWGYDDNINNTINVSSYNSNYGVLNREGNIVKSTFYETAALFNHIYKYNDDLSFRNGLVFYKQDFTKDATKQLDVMSFNSTPVYQIGDFSYGLIFGIDNVLYGDNRYLNNYSLTPKISYLIDPTKIYETSIKFLSKRFVQETDEKNNSWVYEYQNKIMFQTADFGIFDLSLSLGREIDEKNITTDVSKDYETLSLGDSYRIDEQFSINSSISFSNVNYSDINSLFDTKRKDNIYGFLIGLGYSCNKELSLGLTYNYVNQDSNQTPSDYDKNTIKTSIYYTF